MDAEKNAVEVRLDYLGGLWGAFAARPEARLLRWVADADARELIDVFVELHQSNPAGIPDVFLPFDTPFRDETSYAADLIRAWRAWFDGIKDDLIEISRDPTWRCPAPRSGEPGPVAVGRVCQSFQQFYRADFRNLAVALVPATVADPAGWCRWLRGLVKHDLPPEVRFLVIDDAAAPALAPLAAAEPVRVVSQAPAINMTEVYRELLAESGGSGPGVVFRKHYVGMLTAAREGNLAAAEKSGAAALAVAGAEKWPDLQVAAQMGLAAVFSTAGRPADALAAYRAAVGFSDAVPPDHPAGPVLGVQTRMAVAGALFAEGRYAEAAAGYEDAGPRASAAADHLLAMENWRMAAACHDLTGATDKSWACGEKALEAGAKIDPELRPNTTLPFAGQGLLRLTGKRAYTERRERLVQTMNALVGPGWEGRRP